jgi:tetratricopeptide (TPR) repeat protein
VDAAFPGPHEQRSRLRTRARLVLRGEPSSDAEAQLRALVQEGMEDPVLRSRLGSYLSKQNDEGQRAEALDLLRSAASEEPDSAELQSNLGWGLVRFGLDEEAIGPFEDALRLDPLRYADQVRLAHGLADTGENERALALLRSALASRPAASWSDEARTLEAQLADAVSSSNADGKGV